MMKRYHTNTMQSGKYFVHTSVVSTITCHRLMMLRWLSPVSYNSSYIVLLLIEEAEQFLAMPVQNTGRASRPVTRAALQ